VPAAADQDVQPVHVDPQRHRDAGQGRAEPKTQLTKISGKTQGMNAHE
jgi:hypothetical protein